MSLTSDCCFMRGNIAPRRITITPVIASRRLRLIVVVVVVVVVPTESLGLEALLPDGESSAASLIIPFSIIRFLGANIYI